MPAATVDNYRPRYRINRTYAFQINGHDFNVASAGDILMILDHPRVAWQVVELVASPAPTSTRIYVKATLISKVMFEGVDEGECDPVLEEALDEDLDPFLGTSNLTIVVTNPGGPVVVPPTPTYPDPTAANDVDETP